jgi:uncharacterized protein involved in type VI secretion and phage assembly
MSLMSLLRGSGQASNGNDMRIYGAVTGIVQDIRDPKGMGRVKVNFPWLGEAVDGVTIQGDAASKARAHSFWARVSTMMAGSGRGSFFVPEVNDEVLVLFEHGELDRPYVVGVLWNKEDQPPQTMDAEGKNNIRAIHTRCGHKVIFNDSDDQPSIRIEDKTGDNYILIDSKENNMTIKVAGDLIIDAQGEITMKSGKNITITAQGNLEAKAQGSGTIQSSSALTVKSDSTTTVEGTVKAEVKGNMVSVNGAGVTEVKGGIVKIN